MIIIMDTPSLLPLAILPNSSVEDARWHHATVYIDLSWPDISADGGINVTILRCKSTTFCHCVLFALLTTTASLRVKYYFFSIDILHTLFEIWILFLEVINCFGNPFLIYVFFVYPCQKCSHAHLQRESEFPFFRLKDVLASACYRVYRLC